MQVLSEIYPSFCRNYTCLFRIYQSSWFELVWASLLTVLRELSDGFFHDRNDLVNKQECLSALCRAIFKVEEVIFFLFLPF